VELYRQYLKEREGVNLLDYEWGFATYSFEEDCVYLQDIYIVPERRGEGLGVQLMNEVASIAKTREYEIMMGSVDDQANGCERMKKVMKHLGFSEFKKLSGVTYYIKEI